jgi:hypothetical protein
MEGYILRSAQFKLGDDMANSIHDICRYADMA